MIDLSNNSCRENDSKRENVADVASIADKTNATNATTRIDSAGVTKVYTAENNSITRIRTANACIREAKALPPMYPLLGTLWQTGEISFLVGDTGVGKSILAVNVANAIASGKELDKQFPVTANGCGGVLYYDLELSDKQFEKRFTNENFSDNLYRVDINPKCVDKNFSFQDILRDIEETGSKIIIIDNITALSLKPTAEADAAIGIMKNLHKLKLEQGISILVLAHTPKIAVGTPISINHLAGSKILSNFADSIFFIARSKESKHVRYIKQVKSRNAEEQEGVFVCKIVNKDNQLTYEFGGVDSEQNHILQTTIAISKKDQYMETVLKLRAEGNSLEKIGETIGSDKATISRWLK